MKNLFILFFALLLHCPLFAQNGDTLLISLEKTQPDSFAVLKLLKAVSQTHDTLHQKKLLYLQKALRISEKISFKAGVARAYRGLGLLYFNLGDYALSLDANYKALELADNVLFPPNFKANVYAMMGKTHEKQENLDQAEVYFTKSYELNTKNKQLKNLAYDYSNLANVALLRKNYEKCLQYREEEKKLKEEFKDTVGLAFTYNDIALVYEQQGKLAEAAKYLEKSVQIFETKALGYYKTALNLNLAEIYLRINKNAEAEKIALQSLQEATKLQAKDLALRATGILYTIYGEQKSYAKAYEYLLLHKTLQDSTYNEERLKEISKMESNFQVKQQQKENELLRRENELKTEEIKIKDAEAFKNRLLIILSGFAVLLLVVVASVFYRNIQLKKKSNDILTQKNKEISQQKEEISTIAEDLREVNQIVLLKNIEIEKKNEDILSSINYAKRIQSAMLPLQSEIAAVFGEQNFFIYYKPRDIVSGDFYWFHTGFSTKSYNILAAADCTGHGVPGAFMSMIGNDLLNEIVGSRHIFSPELILQELNFSIRNVLKQDQTDSRDGMDIAIITLWKDDKYLTTLEYSGAMNSLYLVHNEEFMEIKADKKPIGGFYMNENMNRNFTKHSIDLDKNSTTIYLCSDGYQDQFGGENGRKFMVKQLREKLFAVSKLDLATQKESLATSFENWKGKQKQVDDVMIIGLKIN
jgi:serine phosphatase RsbU (regulator of sigma subunit)